MIQPICCMGCYEDKLLLKVNNFKGSEDFLGGYRILNWCKEGDSEITYLSLNSPYVLLDNLDTGYYTFYTEHPINHVDSIEMTVYFLNNSYQNQISKLWNNADIEDNEYTIELQNSLLDLLVKNPTTQISYLLYYLYNKIQNIEDFEFDLFFRLITVQETIENMTVSNMNRYGANFAKLKISARPTLIFDKVVNVIKIYRYYQQNKQLYRVITKATSPMDLELPEGYFEIQLLKDNELLTILRHCRPSDDYISMLWERGQDQIKQYSDISENTVLTTANLSDFDEDEISNYKQELSITPRNNIIPRIEIKESDYSRAITLYIKGVSYAMISEHDFYVSGKDIDFLEENSKNRFYPLVADTDRFYTRFEPAENMLDKEALFYIVDENNRIVSRITRCLLDQDPETSLVDYYEKIRQAELSDYLDRLINQLKKVHKEAVSSVQEFRYHILQDVAVNIDNVLVILLEMISTLISIDKDLLIYEVLKYHFVNLNYNPSFFSKGGLFWSPYTFTLTTEQSQDGYVLCIIAKYQEENRYHQHYIHSKPTSALDIVLNKFGNYVIYAVSEKDYKMSGFLYLNTITKYYKGYLLEPDIR